MFMAIAKEQIRQIISENNIDSVADKLSGEFDISLDKAEITYYIIDTKGTTAHKVG